MFLFPFPSFPPFACLDPNPNFGQKSVFDTEVAEIFDATENHGTKMMDKFFRSRNNNDIVTRVPPLPYKHVGKEIYFDRL